VAVANISILTSSSTLSTKFKEDWICFWKANFSLNCEDCC